MPDTTWLAIAAEVDMYKDKRWDKRKLDRLANLVRLVSQGVRVEDREILDAVDAFAPNDQEVLKDPNDYAAAIELGNQVIAESPYPYQLGSVYLKDYKGNEMFRRGGFYAEKSQAGTPVLSKPDEDLLKFRTPLENEKGKLTDARKDEGGKIKEFVGENLNQYKWNPWLYPHDPNHSITETHNVLKTLEYGYKDIPTGEDLTGHSPHLVILFTGHE